MKKVALAILLPLCCFSTNAFATTLNFDDVASGTNINNQYAASAGITLSCIGGKSAGFNNCSGGNVYAVTDPGAASAPNVLSLTSGQLSGVFTDERLGYYRADFAAPVAYASIDARAILPAEGLGGTGSNMPFLQAFDAAGHFLARAVYTYDASLEAWHTLEINRTEGDIAFIVFSSFYTSGFLPVYGEFDNLDPTTLPQGNVDFARDGTAAAPKPVPEPPTGLLLGASLLCLFGSGHLRRYGRIVRQQWMTSGAVAA